MSADRKAATAGARALPDTSAAQFASDVQYYLSLEPRQLPSRYLYDELGSALFEAICRLPWYRITRAEERLLADRGAEVFRRVAPIGAVVELGSGSGRKLRTLLETAPDRREIDVHLVDLSSSALEHSARTLAPLDGLRIVTHQASYETGLSEATRRLDHAGRLLVLFLGSNIGNFDPPASAALLAGIRREISVGDALLLGADLVKPEDELRLAYDDPLGVTAAFNRNLLVRVNRELGGNFAIDEFEHRAVWNAAESRVEMHLVARSRQEVRVEAAELAFSMDAGETIWTESSYKYRVEDLAQLLGRAGFNLGQQWVDRRAGFALTLVEAV